MMPRTLLLFVLIVSLSVFSCTSFQATQKIDTVVLKLDTTVSATEDSAFLSIISPYKQQIDGEMNEILGYADRPLKKGNPEGLLNNLVSDIILEETNKHLAEAKSDFRAQFSVLNNGGLRASLPEGALTTRHIYELMPFDNEIVVLKLTGKNCEALFNYIARQQGVPVAGIKMGIKDDKAVNVLINGEPFVMEKEYYMVTSDYLANGGDKMSFFAEPQMKLHTTYLVRDAIINFIKRQNATNKVIDSQLDKRIYFE